MAKLSNLLSAVADGLNGEVLPFQGQDQVASGIVVLVAIMIIHSDGHRDCDYHNDYFDDHQDYDHDYLNDDDNW